MKDELKAKLLRDLMGMDIFQAQVDLEDELINALLNKMVTIDLSKVDVHLEYAKLRGSVEAIKMLKGARDRKIEESRSRDHSNS